MVVFFATSQELATWAIVSGIKWPKQPISMEMRLTDKPEAEGCIVNSYTGLQLKQLCAEIVWSCVGQNCANCPN